MEFNNQRYSTDFGFIDYCYIVDDEKYPEGLLIFMGSLIYREFRHQGHFNKMIRYLLNQLPEGTLMQAPVSNKRLLGLFKSIGFVKVDRIEYWEKVSNATMMEAKLDKSKL